MGQHDNYPISYLQRIKSKYPDNIIIIDDLEFQSTWEVLYRAATDIQFVSSPTESFELAVAEALLFGATVISTEAGRLSEILVNKTHRHMTDGYNSYLFETNNRRSTEGLQEALTIALKDCDRFDVSSQEKEKFLRGLIKDALRLSWNRRGGPIEKYTKVYNLAMSQAQKELSVNVLYEED